MNERLMNHTPTPKTPLLPANRLISLDVLRGLTIAAMILVNNNGDAEHAYKPLHHSAWNGWTPTDIIFPTFLFMVGLSMAFSFPSRLAAANARTSLLPHILRRTLILFLLGLVVNSFPFFHLHDIRIYGVLQRIAFCYFFTSLLMLYSTTWGRVAATAAALLGYWVLLRYVPIPGFGIPGRDIPLLDPYRNIVAFVDRWLLPGHLYGDGSYDPEGLLSTIPAVATTLFGTLTGEWLRTKGSNSTKAAGILAAGIAGILAGEIWSQWFPINKRLWTSSYVLLAAGITLVLLAVLYWLIDCTGWKKGWTVPWLAFGTNAIALYVFSELVASSLDSWHTSGGITLKQAAFSPIVSWVPNLSLASLLYSVLFVIVCAILALWMYRQKLFLKI
jgi:predicted acyltransferase